MTKNRGVELETLISIIIPVYNTGEYLKKCVVSVCNQTYGRLEIILVDDGSTDGSGEICDQLKTTDKRIVVIHRENGGLSAARNTGINASNGDYIVFVDSDDWIEEKTIEVGYRELCRTKASMVIWGYYADFVDNEERIISTSRHVTDGICRVGDCKALVTNEALGLIGYAWNKLYKKDIIIENRIFFVEGLSLVEDILFNAEICRYSESICFTNYIGTHYIQRPRKTLGNKFYENYFELKLKACDAREAILKKYGANNEDIQRLLTSSYLAAVTGCIRGIKQLNLENRDRYDLLASFLRCESLRLLLTKVVPKTAKETLLYYLLKYRMRIVLSIIL